MEASGFCEIAGRVGLFEMIHVCKIIADNAAHPILPYFRNIQKLFPDERLFASHLETRAGLVGYRARIEAEMQGYCRYKLLEKISRDKFFDCHNRA